MPESEFIDLINNLRRQPAELEWFEFKRNHIEPQQIGEYLSALANAACLTAKPHGYLIFGVDDATHAVVGTDFNPYTAKGSGNQDLLIWLNLLLAPDPGLEPYIVDHPEGRVALLRIAAARSQPVRFQDKAFIRIGSSKTELNRYPEKERALWRIFDRQPFETGIAAEHQSGDEVLRVLHCPTYFDLLNIPLPRNHTAILEGLAADKLIVANAAGGWDITNLGAILFARKLADFPRLQRKAIRVVQYKGTGRTETLKKQGGAPGYAAGFAGLISHITGLIPANEVIGQALRRTAPMFPPLAVRELVANALIHQDFTMTGTGPMVEIFDNRLEITNPGEPLVEPQRFLDARPRSRNEVLASLMRRFGICEERGSGIDKVVQQIEAFQLPAPLFEAPPGFTRATLFPYRPFNRMDKQDRVRACYLHACLKREEGDYLTNPSLRERFGMEQQNNALVSRYIREALDTGLIKPFDENAPRRLRKYLPFWA